MLILNKIEEKHWKMSKWKIFLKNFTDELVDIQKLLETIGKTMWRHFLIKLIFIKLNCVNIEDIHGKMLKLNILLIN